jgi:hypothetical protein
MRRYRTPSLRLGHISPHFNLPNSVEFSILFAHNVGGMVRKGLLATPFQVTLKVEAG